jgi:predicted MFS family arabinose efflux permease
VPNVRESKVEGHPHYDVPGALSATAGMLSVVFGVSQASTNGWGSASSWPFLALGALLLAIFFVIEGRIKEPLLPLRLITDRVRAGAFLGQLFVGLGLFGMFLFMTFYFQDVEQYSAVKTGLLFMPFSIGVILAAGLTSQLLPKVGPRPLATIGNLMAAFGMLYLSFIKVDSSYVTSVMPAMIVTSLGLGVAFVSIASTALFNVRPEDTGAASAVLTTSQQIGGSFGTAIANTIVVSSGTAFLVAALRAHPSITSSAKLALIASAHVHGYDESFRFGALMLFLAAVLFFGLVNIDRHHLGQHDEVAEVYPAST